MKVESLIQRVRHRYAFATRYSDRGNAVLMIGSDETRIGFETSFERHDRFSFSFTESSSSGGGPDTPGYRIDWDGAHVSMVGEHPLPGEATRSLGLAIASVTGISFGCAHTIPRLLMPDVIDGRELFGVESRALGEPVEIDGAPHHALYLREGSLVMLAFVNEATLVIRRTEGPHPVVVTDYFASLTA